MSLFGLHGGVVSSIGLTVLAAIALGAYRLFAALRRRHEDANRVTTTQLAMPKTCVVVRWFGEDADGHSPGTWNWSDGSDHRAN
jgi:hypothetical protein